MNFLEQNSRVRVTDKNHPLEGKTGTVVRPLIRENGAWVQMDKPLPNKLESFPKGNTRHHHILLYPEQCTSL
jgi:hypothetical protein